NAADPIGPRRSDRATISMKEKLEGSGNRTSRQSNPGQRQRALGNLFCRLFLTRLITLHDTGRLAFFGSLVPLADRWTFLRRLSPVRSRWHCHVNLRQAVR